MTPVYGPPVYTVNTAQAARCRLPPMSPEAQFIFYLVAFAAFLAGAVVSFARPWPQVQFWISVGLAAWVLIPLWDALEAL